MLTSRARPVALAVLASSTVALAACSSDLGAPEGVTEQSSNFSDTWRVFLVGAVAVSALIWVLVLVAIVRFRRRSDDIPRQRQYNIPLEVVYTAVPLLAVGALFAISVVAENGFTDLSDDPDVTVEVVGFQWQWQFRYPDDGIVVNGTDTAPAQLVLPVGRTVRLKLEADDVNHSFWVPEFLSKRDLIPGIDNEIDVEVTESGEWTGRCAEYCGLDHWRMTFTVTALPAEQYDTWVGQARAQAQPLLAPLDLPSGEAEGPGPP